MSLSKLSRVGGSRANPNFNYQLPVRNRNHKGYVIIPNFDTSTGPINERLAIAKNSECPSLLKVAGHLTKDEDESILYHELESGQPYYVAAGSEDDNPVFTCQYFGQKDVKAITPAYEAMKEAREIAHRKGTGPKSRPDVSEFEQRMIGSKTRLADRRAYPQGFTVTLQQDAICAAPINAAMIENAESTGRLNQLIAIAASHLLASCAPKELLDFLTRQAESAVPLTFGDEGNKFFSIVQYNYSGADIDSLELAIGDVGALHVDGYDDPTLWTVLLILSNIPKGYWPGRTFVLSLRVYAIMGPMTAIVFKAVHPHISLGPSPMADFRRAPYRNYLSDDVLIMDPELYHQSRLAAVCYPKKAIMRKSPALIRRSTPAILQMTNGLRSSLPEAHPVAIAAFGTRRNQMESLARLEAHDMCTQVCINTALIMPSANWFAEKWRWKENGVIMTPRVSRIQAVIDGHGKENEWYTAYKAKCEAVLLMTWFQGKKKGESVWVSTEKVGSTFTDSDPSVPTAAERRGDFNKRDPKRNNAKEHKRNDEAEGIGGPVAETSLEGSSEEEPPFVRRRRNVGI
ncbi:hypothetical protein SBOR_10086 [Sclerotinia borealis F-4128]|uniref:Uncharacterized protein n=1 Tax=Sclerotinia borealis (strain F-4128) TaxID=1432307 RepID=W9C4N1_SCLBF|nr:hypothetical protein SBOR_10086 [Sclerotinia borealis F-4128]